MCVCSQADRFASTPSTGKSVYVHAFVHRYIQCLYGCVYCTLTMSKLVKKYVDACLPGFNFYETARGGWEGG